MSTPSRIQIAVFSGRDPRLTRCLALRRRVFIDEQQVPEDLEVDGLDPACVHVLVEVDGVTVGTARLRITDEGVAKAERVAVSRSRRGEGIGRRVMRALEREAAARGRDAVVLGAQTDALPFYEKLGYDAYGPEFMDAGIPHRMMRLPL